MSVENQDQQIKEVENVVTLISLKRKHGDSSMEVYIRYPKTLSLLQSIGYEISVIEKTHLTKIMIKW